MAKRSEDGRDYMTVSLPKEVLDLIDQKAKAELLSRSAWVRRALKAILEPIHA